ncbi:glutathione S-transferase [Thalassospira xiamenensis M-5 = DSM 17429]|uniref:glutathione transferase n=1 Tax=Thalassospira xiamenensis M-5 = DSM 17429 TaxID=1123366 RepID=A0AB72U7S1_9PROT|nr:glutathione S-transferase family protein [Thalassospira xiamenensis]AJD50231.1 glutathione s-transferase protein [Thalassospira xiamenensis M-5 = DSM 17429]SIT27342.1 glutathione S-transferase [Thalassospira xiamenensis M-5 = DSM 17429]
MSKVIIYGMPRSSLARTVRIACIEKQISFEFHTKGIPSPGAEPTPELLQFNPFGKVPVLVHDNLVLYETSAICRYIDDAFDGPLLRPVRKDKVARMEQWISVATTRLNTQIVRQFVIPMVFADTKQRNDPGFAARMKRMGDLIAHDLKILDPHYDDGWLFGQRFTIPDMLIMPMIHYLKAMPGGPEILAEVPNLDTAFKNFQARHSAAMTDPLLPDRILRTA